MVLGRIDLEAERVLVIMTREAADTIIGGAVITNMNRDRYAETDADSSHPV